MLIAALHFDVFKCSFQKRNSCYIYVIMIKWSGTERVLRLGTPACLEKAVSYYPQSKLSQKYMKIIEWSMILSISVAGGTNFTWATEITKFSSEILPKFNNGLSYSHISHYLLLEEDSRTRERYSISVRFHLSHTKSINGWKS